MEKEILKGLTRKSLIIGIIGVLIVNFFTAEYGLICDVWSWQGYPNWTRNMYDASTAFYNSFAFAFMFMLIIAAINQVKHIFSAMETAVIYIMILVGGAVMNTGAGLEGAFVFFYQSSIPFALGQAENVAAERYYEYTSSLIRADPEYTRYMIQTSMAVPDVSKFMGNILWVTLFFTCAIYSMYFLMLLFRRTWVDLESLQFPLGELSSEFIELTQPANSSIDRSRVKLFKAKWFWIGFAIQFIYLFIEVGPNVITNWAASSPWSIMSSPPQADIPGTNIKIAPRFDLGTYALIWSTLVISLEPWRIGWCSMLSLDVLVGFLIGWFVLWIIYPLALGTSWGPVPSGITYTWGMIARVGGYYYPKGGSPSAHLLGFAMMMSIFALSAWRNRSTILPILKGLFKEPTEDVDSNKPLSYRVTWLAFIVSFVATIGLAAAVGVDVAYFTAMWVLWLVFLVAFARLSAETGAHLGSAMIYRFGGWFFFVEAFLLGIWGYKFWQTGHSMVNYMTMFLTTFGCGGGLASGLFVTFNSMASFCSHSWKIGKRTKTMVKDILMASLIAVFVAALAQGVFRYMWMHIMPFSEWTEMFAWVYPSFTFVQYSDFMEPPGHPENVVFSTSIMDAYKLYPWDFYIKIIIGVAIPFILFYLRTRWTWLRVSAAGIASGAIFGPVFWSAAIVAIIIKYIVLKVGGTRLYTDKVVPFATGLIVGMLMVYLIFVPIATPIWRIGREPTPF